MRGRPPMRRVAVGRYYYAMYHAMRAVVYFRTPGDDHEQHSDLPRWTQPTSRMRTSGRMN